MNAPSTTSSCSPLERREVRAKLVYTAKAAHRRISAAPADLLRPRGDLVPPTGLSNVGDGDFTLIGNEFLSYFIELAGLEPHHRVLDMGCGIGRMAVPLMDYLQEGSYAGFDVGKKMIGWCRRNITPKRPDFEFAFAPVFNSKYNPFGTLAATEYRFPYPDSSFDFVFATSLFTHLLPAGALHYLGEAGRVLRPGGTCFATFFLLTPAAEQEIAARRARLGFRHEFEGAATINPRRPEEAIAHRLDDVRAIFAESGLTVNEPIHHGAWANAANARTLQDIVVARRDVPQ